MFESEKFPPLAKNAGKSCHWWRRGIEPPRLACKFPKAEILNVGYSGCSGTIDPKTCIRLNPDLYRSVIRDNNERDMRELGPEKPNRPQLRIIDTSEESV